MSFSFRNALAVVPARGGSKRMPRKNLRLLGGKPLVCHTLETAVESGCFADIMLSSDDPEILDLAAGYEEVTAKMRDPDWADDQATIFEFLHHLINEDHIAPSYDAVALLLPTAPFRSVGSIRGAVALLSPVVDSVVSLCRFDFPPQFGVYLDDKNLEIKPAFNPSPLLSGDTRSQDQVPILHPNGALFIAWRQSYSRFGSFYRGQCLGYEMSRMESIDIDTEADLEYAEFVLQRHNTSSSQ